MTMKSRALRTKTVYKTYMKYAFTFLTTAALLSGCVSIDKERATEQRKAELCAKIETQHLSHCPGNHIPPPPPN